MRGDQLEKIEGGQGWGRAGGDDAIVLEYKTLGWPKKE